jgi:hypothetical protein
MKLVQDWLNGGRWQWKYYLPSVGRWFDYGKSYDTHAEAIEGKGGVN